jgi:hypothetical protein
VAISIDWDAGHWFTFVGGTTSTPFTCISSYAYTHRVDTDTEVSPRKKRVNPMRAKLKVMKRLVRFEQKTDLWQRKKGRLVEGFHQKSLFLSRTDTVFDPATDVVAYKGLRPLCNLSGKKGMPMYVHPEFVYDENPEKAEPRREGKAFEGGG